MDARAQSRGRVSVQALVPFLALMVVVAFYLGFARQLAFQCPRCGTLFKVPGVRLLFSLHLGFLQLVTCPACGYSGMMRPFRPG